MSRAGHDQRRRIGRDYGVVIPIGAVHGSDYITEADGISPLSGVELFRQKVSRVISMGKPDNDGDFNWGMDPETQLLSVSACGTGTYRASDKHTSFAAGARCDCRISCICTQEEMAAVLHMTMLGE